MIYQDTLGSLLMGVSQQPARVRLPGQVTEQINLFSSVDRGLSSRTGNIQVSALTGATETMAFRRMSFNGTTYIFGFEDSDFKVWDVDGTAYTVNYEDTPAQDYVGDDMSFHVYDDDIFCVNRETLVATEGSADGFPFHVTIVSALGGVYSRTYTVTITFDDASTATGSYTTPDGTNNGDSEKTSSSYIMGQIKTALDASGDIPSGYTTAITGDVLLVEGDGVMTVNLVDGESGTILRGITDFADSTADLPKYAPHGTIVRVTGDTADEDDYFLRFNAEGIDTEGTGFGTQGVWEEWYDPDQVNALDSVTMPHVLTLSGSTFTLSRGNWATRRVGDDDSNPMPSFVGYQIRDIAGFESRLVFSTSKGTCVTSRTLYPLDFFRKSATVQVESDPVDMKSTREGSLSLDWILPFDRDLILLSDPGESQFVVTGGGLTPQNASMVETTSYEMFGQARPVLTGRTLVFPFSAGDYAGLQEFFTNDQVSTNGADPLTAVQQTYIPGVITNMATSKNFNTIVLRTDNEATNNTVWVYKYLWDAATRIQASWSKWEFTDEVREVFFVNSKIYIIVKDAHGHWLCEGDMNLPIEQTLGYHLTLDRKVSATVASGSVTLPYEDARFAQSTGCLNVGREIVPTSVTPSGADFVYAFNSAVAPDGATVIGGQTITREVTPTMPMVKDSRGNTVSSAELILDHFKVHLKDSGEIIVVMTSPYREDIEFAVSRFPLDDEPLDPTLSLIADSVVEVPWGEDAALSEMTIKSTNIRPTRIIEVEFEGQVTGVKRRL